MAQKVLAVDPGNFESGYCIWDGEKLFEHGNLSNKDMLAKVMHGDYDLFMCEYVQSYGKPVGNDTFDTVFWIGRFCNASEYVDKKWFLVTRMQIKMHHCHHPGSKDSHIRQALIDKYGSPGTKKEPGVLHGVVKHIWSAVALATYATETNFYFNHYLIKSEKPLEP